MRRPVQRPSRVRIDGHALLELGRNSLAQAVPTAPRKPNIVSFAAGRQCRWSTYVKDVARPSCPARDHRRLTRRRNQACSFSHFVMKLFFAAPLSGLPSDPIAFGAHASRLHLVMKLFFAAPTSALPFFPTALLSQVS